MKYKILFLICFLAGLVVYAETPIIPVSNTTQVQPETKISAPPVSFENCFKTYNTSIDNLFYLTLAALNLNNYKIDEMQSRTGYISFNTNGKTFLISITSVDSKNSMIRITPVDNNYNFSQLIVDRIFSYLTNNVK